MPPPCSRALCIARAWLLIRERAIACAIDGCHLRAAVPLRCDVATRRSSVCSGMRAGREGAFALAHAARRRRPSLLRLRAWRAQGGGAVEARRDPSAARRDG
eukprot:5174986-Pleurochrysis_carterae.AAC.1